MKELEDMSPAELVEEFGRGEGDSRGWRSALARQVGVHRSFIGNLARGTAKGVGPDVRRRLISAVKAQRDGEPHPAEPRGGTADSELDAMQSLTGLDDAARRRVLAWANNRWGRA